MTKLQIMLQTEKVPIEHILNDIKYKKEGFKIQEKLASIGKLSYIKNPDEKKWIMNHVSFSDYINYIDEYDNTALIYAIRLKDIHKIKVLLDNEAKFSYIQLYKKIKDFGNYPKEIHETLIEVFFKKDNNIKKENEMNWIFASYIFNFFKNDELYENNINNVIQIIFEKSNEENVNLILKVLLKNIEKINENSIRDIVNNKKVSRSDNTDFFLRSNKNFQKKIKKAINQRNKKGETLLGIAIKRNFGIEIFENLYKLEVDINKKYTRKIIKGDKIEYDYKKEVNFYLKNKNVISINLNSDLTDISKEKEIENSKKVIKYKNKYILDEYPIHQAFKIKAYKALDALLTLPYIKERIKDKNDLTLEDKGYLIKKFEVKKINKVFLNEKDIINIIEKKYGTEFDKIKNKEEKNLKNIKKAKMEIDDLIF